MLILASSSPRRVELLINAGMPFTQRVPDVAVDEVPHPGERPRDFVRRLALEKANAVPVEWGEVVLAADTIVVVEGQILGKPQDREDAVEMLMLLANGSHDVITGICLRNTMRSVVDEETTRVWFGPITEQEIEEYVASGEPMDKAGAYGIQGLASKFITRLDGCYFNVVGLPVSLVYRHLRSWPK